MKPTSSRPVATSSLPSGSFIMASAPFLFTNRLTEYLQDFFRNKRVNMKSNFKINDIQTCIPNLLSVQLEMVKTRFPNL